MHVTHKRMKTVYFPKCATSYFFRRWWLCLQKSNRNRPQHLQGTSTHFVLYFFKIFPCTKILFDVLLLMQRGVEASENCWRQQCAKCREFYIGDPSHGHQVILCKDFLTYNKGTNVDKCSKIFRDAFYGNPANFSRCPLTKWKPASNFVSNRMTLGSDFIFFLF